MSGQQIYEWLKRHNGKLLCGWYQPGVGRVLAPCRAIGERLDSSQWVVVGGRA